ncbi:MAG: acyl-CoA dehydrogenase family protein [Phycisphaerales bacterium]|nr:acyl-CoA dehydrogenase family protein [Phycisphaerales bacterium]
MDFRLTEDHQQLRNMLREFCLREIAPRAATRDQEGRFEPGLVQKLGELGLFGLYVPEEYGGAGMDVVGYIVAIEELSRACAATGILVSAHHSLCVDPILHFGTAAQKRTYLPKLAAGEWIGCLSLTEPGSGSDAGAARCMAVEKDGGWVINGTKNFVTNGGEADVILLLAVTDPGHPRHRMSAFIVEKNTPGCQVGKLEKKLGIRASSTAEIVFENCFLPGTALVGERGRGLSIALATLDGGRIGVAAQAVGISQAALDAATEYANTRVQFGETIGMFQAIQWKLANMAMGIQAARLLMHRAAWLKATGRPYSGEAAMAKLLASETSSRVCGWALQVFGGYGYCQDYPVERLLRDARITELYEGTSEIQRLVLARRMQEPDWILRDF